MALEGRGPGWGEWVGDPGTPAPRRANEGTRFPSASSFGRSVCAASAERASGPEGGRRGTPGDTVRSRRRSEPEPGVPAARVGGGLTALRPRGRPLRGFSEEAARVSPDPGGEAAGLRAAGTARAKAGRQNAPGSPFYFRGRGRRERVFVTRATGWASCVQKVARVAVGCWVPPEFLLLTAPPLSSRPSC